MKALSWMLVATMSVALVAGCGSLSKTTKSGEAARTTDVEDGKPMAAVATGVTKLDSWGKTSDGKDIERYALTNNKGMRVEVVALGGAITRLIVPDRDGKPGNIVLGCATPAILESSKSSYVGPLIGRFANRIAAGKFTLDGASYTLPTNDNGINTLHGGTLGFDKRLWKLEPLISLDGASLQLTMTDLDGSQGFPGTVNVKVVYHLTSDNVLHINYEATTDKATPISLTYHGYFNLKDAGKSDIKGHMLKLSASRYTPVNANLIPTGELAPVKGTIFDFTTAKSIGQDIEKTGGTPVGFDHNFVIDGEAGTLRQAAEVYEPTTGRVMTVFTTEPGIQFYSGNFLDGTLAGYDGFAYNQHTALCLETQKFPDSPNQSAFPSSILRPGETYKQNTEFRFSTR